VELVEGACSALQVAKVGRTTGLTYGVIMAYGLEYYADEDASAMLLDFVIEAEGTEVSMASRRLFAVLVTVLLWLWLCCPLHRQGTSTL